MLEYVGLIIVVIGFIANAIKRAKTSTGAPGPNGLQAPPYPMQQRQATPPSTQAPQQPLAGVRSGSSRGNMASGKQPAWPGQGGRIVSQSPMSSIAQQFALERAASDRQMAAAADQARAGSDSRTPSNNDEFDPRSRGIIDADDFRKASAAPAASRLGIQTRSNLINGVVFAQILTPPLCKSKRKRMTLPNVSSKNHVVKTGNF